MEEKSNVWDLIEVHGITRDHPDGITSDELFQILKKSHPTMKFSEYRQMIACSISNGDVRVSRNGKIYA